MLVIGCCSNEADGNPPSVDDKLEKDRCSWHLPDSPARLYSLFKMPEIDFVLVSLPATDLGSAANSGDARTYEDVLAQA